MCFQRGAFLFFLLTLAALASSSFCLNLESNFRCVNFKCVLFSFYVKNVTHSGNKWCWWLWWKKLHDFQWLSYFKMCSIRCKCQKCFAKYVDNLWRIFEWVSGGAKIFHGTWVSTTDMYTLVQLSNPNRMCPNRSSRMACIPNMIGYSKFFRLITTMSVPVQLDTADFFRYRLSRKIIGRSRPWR